MCLCVCKVREGVCVCKVRKGVCVCVSRCVRVCKVKMCVCVCVCVCVSKRDFMLQFDGLKLTSYN